MAHRVGVKWRWDALRMSIPRETVVRTLWGTDELLDTTPRAAYGPPRRYSYIT